MATDKTRITCSKCGKEYSINYFAKHVREKHPIEG